MNQVAEQATRDAFGEALVQAGKKNPNTVVVSCDLASATRTKAFGNAYPERFFEVGIAEQNALSIAAGLAMSGFRPFISSFGAFITARYDQIKVSCAYNQAGVVIVGTHSGLAIGKDGATQMGTEDINLMSGIPGMHIFQPADGFEAQQIVDYLASTDQLAYLRLSRTPQEQVLPENYQFQFNKAFIIKEGTDIALLATGDTVLSAYKSAQLLENNGINAAVINFSTLKPIDIETITSLAKKFPLLVTIEDHNIIGGLGSRVAEVIAELDQPAKLHRIGIPDCFGESGSPADLYKKYHLDAPGITQTIQELTKNLPTTKKKTNNSTQTPTPALTTNKPLISYHLVTWNRLDKLQNLLRSFIACNQYDNFEWILVDHGSTDGTIEFLENIHKNTDYKPLWGKIKVLQLNEQHYINELQEKGIHINSPRRAGLAFFGKYRNEARKVAQGDYFIDIPDDHQFIRKTDWVSEMIAIQQDRIKQVGRDDISSLVFKTRRLFRILKRNQATGPEQVSRIPTENGTTNIEYYVCKYKGYDDYGMVSRSVAEHMGPYWQIDDTADPTIIQAWNDPENEFFNKTAPHYQHFLKQAQKLGLKKIMTKYPYTHDLMNDRAITNPKEFAVPLATTASLRNKFYSLNRPISFEEIENHLTGKPDNLSLLKTKVEAKTRSLIR